MYNTCVIYSAIRYEIFIYILWMEDEYWETVNQHNVKF